jgi:dipeptidyl aminopeptidase/acylaminoacyl peptidase
MNKDFLNQIPSEEQPIAKKLQSVAEDIQMPASFQAKLEAQLRDTHNEKIVSTQSWQAKIIPSLGWAILIVGAVFLLNLAIRSLMPKQVPAADRMPSTVVSFEEKVKAGKICQGQLAVAHGYSIFLSKQNNTEFTTLDEQKNIDELRSFSWSPDGKQLALVGNTRGSGNLYLSDAIGDMLQPVLSNSELGYLMGAAWSPDGSQLLTWEINNNTRLYILNKEGTDFTEVGLPLQFFETPQFAPDSENILFYGADSTSAGLFQASVDGSQVVTISSLVENESSFAWSPNGSALAYIEMDRNLGEARLVVEGNGGRSVIASLPIPKGSGSSIPDSANLSWSPDGKNLVFEFGRNAIDRAVYLANVDKADLTKLVESAHASTISADGRCLAYISNQQIYVLDLAATELSPTTLPAPVLLADLPSGRARAYFQLDKLQWKPAGWK